MLIAQRDAFTTTGEISAYRKTADSGREIDIVRCAKCGTRLWHEPLIAGADVCRRRHPGRSAWAIPTSHIWVEKISPGVVMQTMPSR